MSAVFETYEMDDAGEADSAHPYHPGCAPAGATPGDPAAWDGATACEACGAPLTPTNEETCP